MWKLFCCENEMRKKNFLKIGQRFSLIQRHLIYPLWLLATKKSLSTSTFIGTLMLLRQSLPISILSINFITCSHGLNHWIFQRISGTENQIKYTIQTPPPETYTFTYDWIIIFPIYVWLPTRLKFSLHPDGFDVVRNLTSFPLFKFQCSGIVKDCWCQSITLLIYILSGYNGMIVK